MVARAERDERKAIDQVARFMPDDVKTAFVNGNYDTALAGLKEAIAAGDPWALLAWLKAAGVIDLPSLQVVQNVFAQLNVSGDQELAELVEAGRRVRQLRDDGVTMEAMRDEAVEALKLVLREHPEWLIPVVRELETMGLSTGSTVVVESTAEDA